LNQRLGHDACIGKNANVWGFFGRRDPLVLSSRLKLSAIALWAVLVAILATAATASALTYGVAWRNYSPGDLEYVKRSGATVYRLDLNYTCTHGGAWESFDTVVEAAWQRGLTVLPVLTRSVPTCEGPGLKKRFLTPSDPDWEAWWSWAKQAVERYGVNGTFWAARANPTPITSWEVWNEPNLPTNNPLLGSEEKVQPENYGNFLIYTAAAVRKGAEERKAPSPTVLFGGLFMTGGGNYTSYLEDVYKVPGVYAVYQGLSVHPYPFAAKVAGLEAEIKEVRNTLNGLPWGPSRSLWVTEMGWPTTASVEHGVSESEQASLLAEAFDWLKGAAEAKSISLVTWYNLQDTNSGSHWDEHMGLRRLDGTYRPAWFTFQEQVKAPRWPTPGPSIRVAYSDAGDANSISGWQFGSGSGWQQLFLWGHEVAPGTKPAILRYGEGPHIFFVDASRGNQITEWSWNAVTGWQQRFLETDPVAPNSSPSAVIVNGVPQIYFSDAATNRAISVLVYNSVANSWAQSRFYGDPVAANSSPSTIVNSSGNVQVYFADAAKGNSIAVWTWTPTALVQQFFYGDPVAAGSSPSTIVNSSGNVQVYFADAAKGNSIAVWTWTPTALVQQFFYGDPVAAGSSPSAIRNNSEAQIYFADSAKGNTITVWTWGPSYLNQSFFYGDAVAAGTSPSATPNGGQPQVYFVDASTNNSLALWQWGATLEQIRLYGHPVTTGSSPGT
jgi:polysaccharide biosynthesis protein PslG